MLLQAQAQAVAVASVAARPCFRKYDNLREEGGACSLSACVMCSYGGGLTISTRGKCEFDPLRQPSRSRHEKLIPSHTPIRKFVFVAATNQRTSQQVDLSSQEASASIHKTASIPSDGAELTRFESEVKTMNRNTKLHSSGSSNKNSIDSEQIDFAALRSKKLTERFANFKTWWKAVHDTYQEDSATWGYGSSPIFRVYLGRSGQVERVVIDEDEIQRRQFADCLIPGLDNDGNKERAHEKIMLARNIAKDLELGKTDFNRYSSVFAIVQNSSEDKNQIAPVGKLLKQIDVAVQKAAPVLKWTLIIAIPIYGICILYGAYLLLMNRSERDLDNEERSAARLKRMRNLKAQMNIQEGDTNIDQPPLAPSEFMQKILEVREMARQVRSREGLQKPVEDLDTNVEEYQQDIQGPLVTPGLSVESSIARENRRGPEIVKEKYQPEVKGFSDTAERDQSSLVDVHTKETNIDVTCKPRLKVRPHIITSLDEAMAVLGSKHKGDVANVERSSCKEESQLDQNSDNSSMIDDKNLPSNSSESILSELGCCGKKSETEADRILVTNSGEQGGVQENQSMERYEGDDGGKNWKLDQPCAGTQHDVASNSESTEAQTLEPRSNSLSEKGQLDENEVLLMTSDSQWDHLAYDRKLHHLPEVSAEGLYEVVGSGQPLGKTGGSRQSVDQRPIFSSTKQWSKELHRKYSLERDPEVRELMREIGSELDSWVTEEEIEETARLAARLEEGDDEYVQRSFTRVQNKIKEEKEKFGLDAVLEKYKEYQPKAADKLWWLDLPCVLCLLVASEEGDGLYGLDMSIDDDGSTRSQAVRHVVAFEDRKDASNFGHLLELRSNSRFQVAEVCPFSPKELLEISKEEGFHVTVLKSGQIQTHVDQTLKEVEDKILEIGRSVYWEELEREHSIDIDSILHQRFGL